MRKNEHKELTVLEIWCRWRTYLGCLAVRRFFFLLRHEILPIQLKPIVDSLITEEEDIIVGSRCGVVATWLYWTGGAVGDRDCHAARHNHRILC